MPVRLAMCSTPEVQESCVLSRTAAGSFWLLLAARLIPPIPTEIGRHATRTDATVTPAMGPEVMPGPLPEPVEVLVQAEPAQPPADHGKGRRSSSVPAEMRVRCGRGWRRATPLPPPLAPLLGPQQLGGGSVPAPFHTLLSMLPTTQWPPCSPCLCRGQAAASRCHCRCLRCSCR